MEHFIKVEPGVNIYVNDLNPGGKKTLLFLHGWPLSHKAYEYQLDIFPKLGYRCLGMDTRGFGRSSKPASGYSYNRLADDVRRVVEALNLRGFVLAGHSMGGATAIRYMARYKGYGVSKLALFGAAAPSLTIRPDFPFGVPKEVPDKLIEGASNDRPQMLTDLSKQFFYQKLSQPFYDWFVSLGLEAAGWSTIQCIYTFRDEYLLSDLSSIRVPTVIMHGVHDEICLFTLAEILNKSIRDSVLIPFENSGHGLFYEEREKFNEELIRFIES